MTEEERAALYRRQAQARELAALARWKSLTGSASAYRQRLTETETLQRDEGWDPAEHVSEEERLTIANG